MRGIDACTDAVKGRGAAAFALAVALTAALSSEAQACVGSGLLIPVSMGLLIFNLAIALIEALVARYLFKARFGRAYGIMVLANYFSLAAGLPLVKPITDMLEPLVFSPPRLLYIRELARVAVWVTFALTIVLEMPFGLWLMRDKKRRLVKAAAFILLSRALIYFLLPIQAMTVGSALSGVETVLPDTHATRNPGALVYYLDNKAGDLWSIRLDGTGRERVSRAGIADEFAILRPQRVADTGKWSLVADFRVTDTRRPEVVVLEEMPGADDALMTAVAQSWDDVVADNPSARRQSSADLTTNRADKASRWQTQGGWGFKGHAGGSEVASSGSLYIHYQTPFNFKSWHAISRLPNDEAVVQIDGQIVLVDMSKDTIAFLVEGHSPLVLPEVASHAVAASE